MEPILDRVRVHPELAGSLHTYPCSIKRFVDPKLDIYFASSSIAVGTAFISPLE
ncbi:MAG: hypothetical protein PHS80_14320 [Methanothrix sp.]|nr:hypothetical protein [Methanothrix sp.]